MDDILSQIIAYAPDKIDTELKARALVQAPRNIDQEPRNMYNQGSSVDHAVRSLDPERDSFKKISNVLGAYRRYRRGEKNPALNFNQFFELYSTENFAAGGSAGQLVQPNNDGSRPGYSGAKKGKRIMRFDVKKEKILMENFNLTEADFIEHGKHGVPQKIDGKSNPKYDKIFRFVQRDFKPVKGGRYDLTDILNADDIEFVKNNFELPKGQKWNFKSKKNPTGFKHGIKATEFTNLEKQIYNKLKGSRKITLASDRSSPQGWLMHAMERVYNNEIKNEVKPKDLTYKPIKKNGIIVGFTDKTVAGNGKTYYGLKKNMQENGSAWTAHGDYNKIRKFLKIAKGAQIDDPSKLLQKILDDKGITKLLEGRSLRLNDILSHERYFDKISEIKPKKLIERQIVLHHTGGVGSGSDLARAAATKDIQLLTGAVNSKIEGLEKIVQGTSKNKARKLNVDEIEKLKNYGAKITDFDGKTVGGGYKDPTKQFAAIEKEALKYAKGDQFNVKTVASYLERLGCGKAAGGRILFAEGVPSLTKCGKAGVAKLEKGLANGFKKSDVGLAQKILGSGKFLKDAVSLRGLFGPAALAFTALTEAGFVASDAISDGKSFREAIGDSAFNYMLGDKTKINSEEEFIKRLKNIPGSPSQGFRGVTDEDIGKMQYFKESLKDMGVGFKNYNTIKDLEKKIEDNTLNQQVPEFADQAFQLNTQLDKAQAENQDYFRTNTADRVSNYLMSDAAGEGAEALQKSNLMAKQDQLNNAYRSSLKGIESLKKEKEDIRGDLYRINNPTEYNEFAKYFMSKPKQEQSMIMGLGYNKGGIASLNVKK